MHVPDGFLDPLVCAVTYALSLAAVGYSARRYLRSAGEEGVYRPVSYTHLTLPTTERV